MSDTPGGKFGLRQCAISSMFVKDGNIVIERFSDGRQQELQAPGRGLLGDVPHLSCSSTASVTSTSEIVAGAVQDAKAGTLGAGTQTYGKGSVQLPNEMSDKSQLRVTIARWYTPKERGIDGAGFVPRRRVARPEG